MIQAQRSDILAIVLVTTLLFVGFSLKIWRYGHERTAMGPSQVETLAGIVGAAGWQMSDNLVADQEDGEPFPIYALESDSCQTELYMAPLASIPDTAHLVRQRFGDDIAFLQRGLWRDEISTEWAGAALIEQAVRWLQGGRTDGIAEVPLLVVTPDPRQLPPGCDLVQRATAPTASHSN